MYTTVFAMQRHQHDKTCRLVKHRYNEVYLLDAKVIVTSSLQGEQKMDNI